MLKEIFNMLTVLFTLLAVSSHARCPTGIYDLSGVANGCGTTIPVNGNDCVMVTGTYVNVYSQSTGGFQKCCRIAGGN